MSLSHALKALVPLSKVCSFWSFNANQVYGLCTWPFLRVALIEGEIYGNGTLAPLGLCVEPDGSHPAQVPGLGAVPPAKSRLVTVAGAVSLG